ncbi:MAG: FAD-dependent oxidoreductase [Candidatus Omnitrophota bacterium]
MREIIAHLTDRIKRTPEVESFRFKIKDKIDFSPGQAAQIIFDGQHIENRQVNKYLSFSSSPTKDYFELSKKLSASRFSQNLRDLRLGDKIQIKAPMGKCVFKEEYKKIAFLIGGIGITPVISIIEYIIEKKLDTDVSLFYSNRTDEDIAFRKELDNWRQINKNIKVYYTLTDCQPKDKSCFSGYIDEKMLKENTSDFEQRMIFIFGPNAMVDMMKALSLKLGCSDKNILTERFIGY